MLLPNLPINTCQFKVVAETDLLLHLKLMSGGYQILLLMEFILVFRGDADILTLDFPKQIENEDQIVQIFEDAAIR